MNNSRPDASIRDMANVLSAQHISSGSLAPTSGNVIDDPCSAPTFIDLFAGAGGVVSRPHV